MGQFAVKRGTARHHYRAFVADGLRQGRRADLAGGGLRRSAGGWDAVAGLRRGREGWAFNERILGTGPFVEQVLLQTAAPPGMRDPVVADRVLSALLERFAGIWGVSLTEMRSGNRRRPTAQARAAVAAVAVTGLGVPIMRVAGVLGVGPPGVCQAIERGLEALGFRSIDLDRVAKE